MYARSKIIQQKLLITRQSLHNIFELNFHLTNQITREFSLVLNANLNKAKAGALIFSYIQFSLLNYAYVSSEEKVRIVGANQLARKS